MVYRYVWYNDHEFTIQVNFMIKCVCGSFGSNSFVTKMQQFPMVGHYKTDVISSVGHLRSNSVVLLVLHTVCCAMVVALPLYYRSIGTASTLLRNGNISSRLYCWTMTITLYIYIYITYMINYHLIMLHVFYK